MKGRGRERKRERLDGGGKRERGMKAKIFMVLRKTVRKRIQKNWRADCPGTKETTEAFLFKWLLTTRFQANMLHYGFKFLETSLRSFLIEKCVLRSRESTVKMVFLSCVKTDCMFKSYFT